MAYSNCSFSRSLDRIYFGTGAQLVEYEFRHSNFLKFLILVTAGVTTFEPDLNNTHHVGMILLSSAGVLYLFERLRNLKN